MEPRTRKLAGLVLAAFGVIVALVGLFADSLGLGGDGPDEFGSKQVIALVVGLAVAAVGVGVALLPRRSTSG
jgi:hypothetical protein